MSSITPVSEYRPVALKRSTDVQAFFFDSRELSDQRPIHISTTSFFRAIDDRGHSTSEWEAGDNFAVNLSMSEAKKALAWLAEAIAQAEAFGFVAEED